MPQHASLTPERWSASTLDQQILMIGNEMNQRNGSSSWRSGGQPLVDPQATEAGPAVLDTAARFGEDQARRYLSGLREAFERLASHPDSGREIAGPEIRCWIPQGQDRVLYRARGNRLDIGRIIHTAREREFRRALDLLLRRS